MNPKIKKYEHLSKRKWYIQGFNATPNLLYFGMTSGIIGINKKVGYGYTAKIHVYKDGFCDYHYGVEDLKRIGKKLIENFRKNKNYIKELIEKDNEEFKEIFDFYRYLDKINITELENKKLIEFYQRAFKYFDMILSRAHIIEGFSLIYDFKLKKQVEDYLKKTNIGGDPNEIFTTLTTSNKGSFMVEENNELINIIKEINQNKELLEFFKNNKIQNIKNNLEKYPNIKLKLEGHQKKFFWVHNNFTGAKVLELDDFIEEIKKMITDGVNPQKLINQKKQKSRKILEGKKNLMQGLPNELMEMLHLTQELTLWQDDRKKNFLITIHYFDKMLIEIAKRFKLEEDLVRYLLPFEVNENNLKKVDNNTLKERKEGCIIICEGNAKGMTTEILVSKDYEEYKSLLEKHQKEEIKEIKGLCGSRGNATGKVVICKGMENLKKVKKGDIIVASMTRPEFVPAMKKAAAIIADEGGLTCHAAIVSRELGIPCVIGTKVATKVLKDGDTVKVNADEGIVEILK